MLKIRAVIAEDDFRVADIHEKFLKNFDEIEVVGKAVNAKKTLWILEQKALICFCLMYICQISLVQTSFRIFGKNSRMWISS